MKESNFSWFKIASFFGVAILILVCFVAMAAGVNLIYVGDGIHGVACILGAIACGFCAFLVYKNYQKKSVENRYGK